MQSSSILCDFQSHWLADRHPVVVAEKSRQIGFTLTTAAGAVLDAAQSAGRDCWYVGYNQTMASEFIRDCAYWSDMFDVPGLGGQIYIDARRDRSVFIYKINFASGKSITALSSKPENLRAKHGNVIIDEAAFHPDLPGLLKAATALTMWGGQIRIISTHNGDMNPFAQLLDDVRAGKFDARIHKVTLRDALASGLYRRLCDVEGIDYSQESETEWMENLYRRYGEDATEELDVIPSSGTSGYISVQAIERAMVAGRPVFRLALPDGFMTRSPQDRELEINRFYYTNIKPVIDRLDRNARHYLGVDFARSGDLSVFASLAEDENIRHHCPFLVECHNWPFDEQWQLYTMLMTDLPNVAMSCIDASGNGAYLGERAEATYLSRAQGVKSTTQHYITHMPKFRAAFDDALITVPRHADVQQDLRSIDNTDGVPKVHAKKRHKGTDGLWRHGDAAMALYFAHCAATDVPPAAASAQIRVPTSHYDLHHRGRGLRRNRLLT